MSDRQWESRITRIGTANPSDLSPHPMNARTHDLDQITAIQSAVADVGWVRPIMVNEQSGYILDGHLRTLMAMRRGETEVPVIWVSVTPEEEALILATFDPLAELAVTDRQKYQALWEEGDPGWAQSLVDRMLARAGKADDLPTGLLEERGRAHAMDQYLNGDARQIHVPMLVEEYARAQPALEAIRQRYNLHRNTDALQWLLERDAEAHPGSDA